MAPNSVRSLLTYASSLVSRLPFGLQAPQPVADIVPYVPLSGAPSCPIDGPTSCHNSTPVAVDSCCFVYPGGRFLLTQFWDENSRGDTAEDWTLHGLWPDRCDGSYDQFCNLTPQFNNISAVLEHYGHGELVDFMNRYWIADRGPNSRLWAHEYNKHGTCINTLATTCYGDSHQTGVEVVDYFTRATALFRTLDTYHALERAGIVPHSRQHYPLVDIVDALEKFSGGRVVLRCNGRGRLLHEVWYVYHVKGSLQSGQFVPAQDLGKEGNAGNCAPWVRYMPKKSSWADL
ncbi:ribonuclease T2 [Thozetella sp. PMI_491]|nr:ribonuclease T2 [Thozetella sp. PMI_491]